MIFIWVSIMQKRLTNLVQAFEQALYCSSAWGYVLAAQFTLQPSPPGFSVIWKCLIHSLFCIHCHVSFLNPTCPVFCQIAGRAAFAGRAEPAGGCGRPQHAAAPRYQHGTVRARVPGPQPRVPAAAAPRGDGRGQVRRRSYSYRNRKYVLINEYG